MAYANGLGGDPEAFANERLTFVDQPDPSPFPYVLAAVTFGTGTLVSVHPAYRAAAEAAAPGRHYHALRPPFLGKMLEEGRRRGASLVASTPELLFALGQAPPAPAIPKGYELRIEHAPWMANEQAARRFENGVGEAGQGGRAVRNQFALVLYERDEPIAVAGVFLKYGLSEIGVDVLRAHRGEGLGRLVVAAATLEILRLDGIPFYGCVPTNVRSHRTALSCGFLPVCSEATVVAADR